MKLIGHLKVYIKQYFFIFLGFSIIGVLNAEPSTKGGLISKESIHNPRAMTEISQDFAQKKLWLPSYLSNAYARKHAYDSKPLFQNSNFLAAKLGLKNGLKDLCGSSVQDTLFRWVFELLVISLSVFLCLWLLKLIHRLKQSSLKYLWVSGLFLILVGAVNFYVHYAYMGFLTLHDDAVTYSQPTDIETGHPADESVFVVMDETPNWFKVHGLKKTSDTLWVKKSNSYFFESGLNICHDGGLIDD